MKITYDKEADAMYIKFSNASFSKNQLIDRQTILNLDADGQIIGIEILEVSKRIPKGFMKSVSVENL